MSLFAINESGHPVPASPAALRRRTLRDADDTLRDVITGSSWDLDALERGIFALNVRAPQALTARRAAPGVLEVTYGSGELAAATVLFERTRSALRGEGAELDPGGLASAILRARQR